MRTMMVAGVVGAWMAVGCGGGSQSSQSTTTPSGGGETMTVDEFFAQVIPEATRQVCGDPESAPRRCFRVTPDECAQVFSASLSSCFQEMRPRLAPEVSQANAEAVARPVGECAAQAYGIALGQGGRYIDGCQ